MKIRLSNSILVRFAMLVLLAALAGRAAADPLRQLFVHPPESQAPRLLGVRTATSITRSCGTSWPS